MKTYNSIQLLGNVGTAPEIKFYGEDNKKSLITFSVATTKSFVKEGEEAETVWHKCVVYNPSLVALTEKLVQKGSKIFINEAEIDYNSYTSSGGNKIKECQIIVNDFILLDSKK